MGPLLLSLVLQLASIQEKRLLHAQRLFFISSKIIENAFYIIFQILKKTMTENMKTIKILKQTNIISKND